MAKVAQMTKFNDKGEPERIYIQEWGSGDSTWCSDRINDADDDCPDIEYVHIDIVNELLRALEELRCPYLFVTKS